MVVDMVATLEEAMVEALVVVMARDGGVGGGYSRIVPHYKSVLLVIRIYHR